MSEKDHEIHALMDDVQRQRDELRLQLHLAKAEARQEWERLEVKLNQARAKMGVVGREAEKAAHEVGAALKLALDELRKGYEQVRKLL